MTTEQYIAACSSPEPPELHALYRRTHLRHLYPRMCSGHMQGRLLMMLTAMVAPRRVLELGTYTGYSALCMAEGMAPGGVIDTVEIDDEKTAELLQTFADNARPGVAINLLTGDAEAVMPGLDPGYDLVFIDANKRRYVQYLRLALDLLRPGGFIIADNTLWDGHLTEGAQRRDAQADGIDLFNRTVAADPTLRKVMLPVRDGLTIIQRNITC